MTKLDMNKLLAVPFVFLSAIVYSAADNAVQPNYKRKASINICDTLAKRSRIGGLEPDLHTKTKAWGTKELATTIATEWAAVLTAYSSGVPLSEMPHPEVSLSEIPDLGIRFRKEEFKRGIAALFYSSAVVDALRKLEVEEDQTNPTYLHMVTGVGPLGLENLAKIMTAATTHHTDNDHETHTVRLYKTLNHHGPHFRYLRESVRYVDFTRTQIKAFGPNDAQCLQRVFPNMTMVFIAKEDDNEEDEEDDDEEEASVDKATGIICCKGSAQIDHLLDTDNVRMKDSARKKALKRIKNLFPKLDDQKVVALYDPEEGAPTNLSRPMLPYKPHFPTIEKYAQDFIVQVRRIWGSGHRFGITFEPTCEDHKLIKKTGRLRLIDFNKFKLPDSNSLVSYADFISYINNPSNSPNCNHLDTCITELDLSSMPIEVLNTENIMPHFSKLERVVLQESANAFARNINGQRFSEHGVTLQYSDASAADLDLCPLYMG